MNHPAALTSSLDALPSGLIVLDSRSRATYVNRGAANVLGADGGELEHQQLETLLPDLMEAVRRTASTGESADVHVRGLDGRYRILGLRAGVVTAEDRGAEGHAVVLRDLTEILSRRRKARMSQLVAGAEMMATAAQHELRNPLFTATSALELLLEQTGLSSEQRGRLQDVVVELDRMARVLSRLRPEPEDVPLAPTRNFRRLVLSTVEAYREQFEEAGRRLQLSLPQTLPAPPMDQSRCTVLLGALLRNGLEAAPVDSTVEVQGRVSADGLFVELEVRDSGSAPDDKGHPDIFSLLDSPRTNTTTLGLAFAKSVAIGAGGDVTLARNRPGGSKVLLRLPVGGEDV